MNIDREKVEQKILIMQQNLNKLRKLRELHKEEFIEDFRNIDSAKYLLQISIEAMLDIASHIIARNRWGKPEDNKAHFQMLADNGVIDKADINIYSNMAKFRNRIVHMYFSVDDEMIYDITKNNLDDFERYIKNILSIIK